MTATANAALRPWQTGHVGLNVSDLIRSVRFYQDVFGFQVINEAKETDQAFAFLSDGERLVLTLWQQSEGEFQKHAPGLHHLSFQAASIEEVREVEQRLLHIGANFLYNGVVSHAEGAQSGGIFFTDPDGIRLEIYSVTGAGDQSAPTGDAPTCGFF